MFHRNTWVNKDILIRSLFSVVLLGCGPKAALGAQGQFQGVWGSIWDPKSTISQHHFGTLLDFFFCAQSQSEQHWKGTRSASSSAYSDRAFLCHLNTSLLWNASKISKGISNNAHSTKTMSLYTTLKNQILKFAVELAVNRVTQLQCLNFPSMIWWHNTMEASCTQFLSAETTLGLAFFYIS